MDAGRPAGRGGEVTIQVDEDRAGDVPASYSWRPPARRAATERRAAWDSRGGEQAG